jgi:hypothetical protein
MMSSIFDGIGDDSIEQLDENLRKWFKEKWVRFGPDGKIRGACARGDDSEGKPKCLPQKKAQNLGKKGRKYAASKKRREDPNPERTGKAKNVATKKKTNEGVPFNECPNCRGPIVHESMMNEKQDACYHKVKSRYKVWPSAYASGALVQCRKKGASNWGTGGKKNESNIMKGIVDEASGTPGGLEHYRTPAMVNTTMQQNLYKRELAPIKAAEKKRKEAEYRKNNPSVSVPSIQIGASQYPIHVIHSWIGSKDLNAAVEFAVNKFAYRQSKDFKTEIAGDPDFQKAVKNFFNVAEKSLNHRDSTRTKSHWDGKIRAAPRETDTSSDGFDAINKINDALLPYYKKYGVDKTGRRVPPNFNYALGEAKAKQYVKPYNDPQTGEQIGWVSSDGYHKKYWQKFAKDSAIKHAKLNPADVNEGEVVPFKKKQSEHDKYADAFSNQHGEEHRYGVGWIECDYCGDVKCDYDCDESQADGFNEDYTGEFAAEKTPAINPYGGLKDNQFRGAISEEPTTSGPIGTQPGGWRRYSPKPAGQLDEEYLDEGLMQKIGAAAMAAALAFGGAKANAEPVYVYSTGDGSYQTVLSPEEIPTNAIRRLIVDTENDDVSLLSKTGTQTPITLDAGTVNRIKQRAGIGQAKPVQAQTTPNQQTAPTQQEKSVAMLDKSSLVFTGYTVDEIKEIMTNDIETSSPDSEVEDKGRSLVSTRYNVQGKNFGAALMTALLKGGNGTLDVITRYNFTKMGNQIRVTPQQFYRMQNVFGQPEMVDGNPGGVVKSWYKHFNPEQFTKKSKKETKEDTAYAGGMGQGGNAGQSYRKFKPKSAGTFKEEQLDEKCWDTHKQVGMKTKGGKSVPNCVPKESAIMKGINRLI